MFFSFDGVDGAGKTTQLKDFCQWLAELGHDVVTCRDPGSTELGEAIRKILLDRESVPIHLRSEMLLYMAARAQLVHEVIEPALRGGRTLVADRFLLANVVYQGYAGGLDVESLWQVGHVATGRVEPAMTFLLDISAEDAAARIGRSPDRMEQRGRKFLSRVREGYLQEAAGRKDQIVVIDASRPVDQVQADIRAAATGLLACDR